MRKIMLVKDLEKMYKENDFQDFESRKNWLFGQLKEQEILLDFQNEEPHDLVFLYLLYRVLKENSVKYTMKNEESIQLRYNNYSWETIKMKRFYNEDTRRENSHKNFYELSKQMEVTVPFEVNLFNISNHIYTSIRNRHDDKTLPVYFIRLLLLASKELNKLGFTEEKLNKLMLSNKAKYRKTGVKYNFINYDSKDVKRFREFKKLKEFHTRHINVIKVQCNLPPSIFAEYKHIYLASQLENGRWELYDRDYTKKIFRMSDEQFKACFEIIEEEIK